VLGHDSNSVDSVLENKGHVWFGPHDNVC
jgi:hypothetical protein